MTARDLRCYHAPEQLDLFRRTLPKRPYATDDLASGLQIQDRQAAIQKAYIQPDTPWSTRWLKFDVDRPGAAEDWQDLGVAAPNIVATNPANGHAHLLYGLAWPLAKHPSHYGKALRYGAAVEGAYRRALDSDPAYVGLICKNPLHQRWRVTCWEPALYDLDWLADWPSIVLGAWEDARTRLPAEGLGRNCTLFERLRLWSYRAIREAGWPNPEKWYQAVLAHAEAINTFPVPLPLSEVRATAKSVAKWTWAHITHKAFAARQAALSRKAAIKRTAAADQRAQGLLEFAESLPPGLSIRQVARMTGTPFESARRLLKSVPRALSGLTPEPYQKTPPGVTHHPYQKTPPVSDPSQRIELTTPLSAGCHLRTSDPDLIARETVGDRLTNSPTGTEKNRLEGTP